MNNKIKFTGIIIGTLLIGFVIGFLANGRLVKSRIDKMQNFYTEKGANQAFIRVLDPTPEQMEKIRPILQRYAQQNRELLTNHRIEQQAFFLELEDELRPFLTQEQMERLEDLKGRWHQRFKRSGEKRSKGSGRRGGPPQ